MATLIAPLSESTGTTSEPAPAGNHVARCVSMVQVGTVDEEYNGEVKKQPKVRLTWELPDELKEYKEGEGLKPVLVSKTYTHSMYSKATLRAHVDSWRGKALTDKEADVFDLLKLMGAPCMLNVVHATSKKGKVYAAVKSIATLPKRTACPDQLTPTTILTYDEFDWATFDALPKFIREDMELTPEFKALKRPGGAMATAANAGRTDIPPHTAAKPALTGGSDDDQELPF